MYQFIHLQIRKLTTEIYHYGKSGYVVLQPLLNYHVSSHEWPDCSQINLFPHRILDTAHFHCDEFPDSTLLMCEYISGHYQLYEHQLKSSTYIEQNNTMVTYMIILECNAFSKHAIVMGIPRSS
jgi:hypothetical protein